MTTRLLAALVLCGLTSTALAQIGPPARRFEVASVRPSPPTDTPTGAVGVRITRAQAGITALTMEDLLSFAFNVSGKQIAGPDWIRETRFDIVATIPAGLTPEDVPAMLQELLGERFQLKVRREPREFPVYALTLAKNGRALTPSPLKDIEPETIEVTGSGGNDGVTMDFGGGSSFALANNAITATHMTMATFAETLTRFVDRTVIDATGETGRFDLTVRLTREEFDATLLRSAVNAGLRLPPQIMRALDAAPANPVGPALETAGLAFDSRRAPLDVIVVESMLRVPTAN